MINNPVIVFVTVTAKSRGEDRETGQEEKQKQGRETGQEEKQYNQ